MKKLPPIEKIYEAWTAVADHRLHFEEPNKATMASSDGAKTYTLIFDPDTNTYYSNDNATFWRGYPGYPVIAMMMEQGVLPLDRSFAELWSKVNWNKINAEHKRDYAAAVAEVEKERGIDPVLADQKAQEVMSALELLPAQTKRLRLSY